MSPYAQDIRDSRTAIGRILGELEIPNFAFTIEATAPGWRLRVECPTQEGWQTIELPVDLAELRASLRDGAVRKRLREAWRERFGDCVGMTRG